MKFSNRIPEIYQRCHEVFGVNWDDGIAITYGDTVYSKYHLAPDVEAHEAVHIEQQKKMGTNAWWEQYFTDKHFRLKQEAEAYKAQLAFAKEYYNRHARRELESRIISDIVNMYGGMCTEEEAIALIHS